MSFNGLDVNMGNLYRISDAKTRSISAENKNGAKGAGGMAKEGNDASRELGQGWKVSPCVSIKAGETYTVADIEGPGAIQHIWMTSHRPLEVFHTKNILGRAGTSVCRMSGRRLFRVRLG